MNFYKAKWEASTPTRVQINVPTNTDYLIGTELYVKGEKKEITTENVTLKDGATVISADTTVNGIPAFSMKSLDAEADKLYDVQFTDGETYNYKFKLYINEDEQSYGSIDLGGTTPAEVSAIVDDAITNYDSQLSTVNLSGTFDDDSTFSYNFVIKS